MKLFFDENLSPKLVAALADQFPDSAHVHDVGLGSAMDAEIWEYAKGHDFVVVTKDDDFSDLSTMHGYPPKVIWIQGGSYSTAKVEELLRDHEVEIREFVSDPESGVLVLL